MTGPENDSFMQLMTANHVGAGFLEVPYDGQTVIIDSVNGHVFREDLRLRAKADLYLPAEVPFTGEVSLSDQDANLIDDSLGARIMAPNAPVRVDEWLLVNGLGMIAGLYPDEEDFRLLEISHPFNVFGKLGRAGYGQYPTLKEFAIEPEDDNTEEREGELSDGLIIVLNEVRVCESYGIGSICQELDCIVAPLAVDTILFHHVLNSLD